MSIIVDKIVKTYGKQFALKNVSFAVQTGQIVGFIGPNGAGKSTMMKIICGYLPPDTGKVLVNGMDVVEKSLEVRKHLGYLPELNPLYPEMYVKEYLAYVSGIYKLGNCTEDRIKDIIQLTGLEIEQRKKIGALSKGYRQRVGLAQALLHDPDVLILDEPTTGLDPNQIIEIRNLISTLGKEKTVMLSTHIMQEVEAICDKVIIINKGEIIADENSGNINTLGQKSIQTIQVELDNEVSEKKLLDIKNVDKVKSIGHATWLLESNSTEDIRPAIFDYCVANNLKVLSLQKMNKKLEEVFRELTK